MPSGYRLEHLQGEEIASPNTDSVRATGSCSVAEERVRYREAMGCTTRGSYLVNSNSSSRMSEMAVSQAAAS